MRHFTYSFLLFFGVAVLAGAADSPQFRGPDRDGIYQDKGLLATWPEGGPAPAWKTPGLGAGYASASVVGDTIYVPGMKEDKQGYIFALGLDGAKKWEKSYGPETEDSMAPGARSTPTIDGDSLYVISGFGVLTCMSAKDGNIAWQVDTKKKFSGADVTWSIAESPAIDGDLIFATPGGPDAAVVALNKKSGETVWTSKGFSEPHAYCSPKVYQFEGRRVLITMTAKSVVGIDVKDGKVLWSHKHETDYDIHANTPILQNGILYYTAGYGSGGGALDVAKDGASVTQKWTDKNLDCQHHGVVVVDGYIYGTGHNHNKLFCLELATGKEMWSTDEVTQGSIVFDEGNLYIYEGPKKGVVDLVKASSQKFERVGQITIPKGKDKHWAHPVIANGRLYIRYADTLYAFDIKAK